MSEARQKGVGGEQIDEALIAKVRAAKVVLRPISAVLPARNNPRTHSEGQIREIAASIREFGWTNPVLVDETGRLIAGHGRVEAAKTLGLTEVPTMTLDGLSDEQKRAYLIADNQLPLNAGWNDELLRVELQDLQSLGFDMGLLGFSAEDLALRISGWESDINIKDKHGENIDGIDSVIRVELHREKAEEAKAIITAALAKSGIVHDIK